MSEVTTLSPEEFDRIAGKVPEGAFRDLVPLIMESFGNERGRTLDTTQVAALAVALMEMSATVEAQITHIGELQGEVDRLKDELSKERTKQKGSKLWKPS